MRVWRLTRQRHATTAFLGIGAERAGSRWTPPGLRVVYTSESIALAVLETLVHMEMRHAAAAQVLIEAEIPDDLPCAKLAVGDLPENWRDYPAPRGLQVFGRDWVMASASAVLQVPSAIVPHEYNFILNPAHPDYCRIRLGSPQLFRFDGRLWKT